MKIRTDFVTNSSSSSFVIAYKTIPGIDEETLAKYPFLRNYGKLIEKVLFTSSDNDTDEGRVFTTKEEYDEYFVENYGWSKQPTVESIIEEDSDLADMYNAVIEYLSKGYKILDKSVGYRDDYCINMLQSLAEDKENFIILEGD